MFLDYVRLDSSEDEGARFSAQRIKNVIKHNTCLALDLVMVSDSGCFFSFTAVFENNSTNS